LTCGIRHSSILGMDQAPAPRRSFWRFSLRELLLVTLAIGAFLGWGHSLYRRYQDIAPTPMREYFVEGGFGEDVSAALKELGAIVPDHPPSPGAGSAGPMSRHSLLIEELAVSGGQSAAFVDDLLVRVRKKIVDSGCREYRVAHRSSADPDEGFNLHYRRETTAGSIQVYVVRIDANRARLLVVLDEHRAP
jgi:hypothetical protein